MKKPHLLILFFIFFSCVFAQEKKNVVPVCQLGRDPVEPDRTIDWTRECLAKPKSGANIIMTTGSGRQVKCFLPPLTPVVVDKSTGVAQWILGCGNKILAPSAWVPDGPKQCGLEQQAIQPKAQEVIIQPGTLRVEKEIIHRIEVGGEIRHTHSGEIISRQEQTLPKELPAELPAQKKSWWQKNRKWVIPLAIAGAAAGGYATASGNKTTTINYQPLPPPIKR
jgi:hypothetical protein